MVSIISAVILKLALISPQINTWAFFQAGGIVLLSDLAASSVIPFHSHFLVVSPAQCWNAAFCYLLKCHSQRYCEAIKFCWIILCEQEDVDRAEAPSFSYYLVFSVLQLVCTINLVQDPPLLYVISVLTSLLLNVFLLLSHLKTSLHSVTRAMSHFPFFIYLHTFPKVHLTWRLLLVVNFLIKDYFQYIFFTSSSLRVLSSSSLSDCNDWVENWLTVISCVQKAKPLRLPQ